MDWLYKKFLPRITMDKYMREMEELRRIIKKQAETIALKDAYINGLLDGQRRTSIRINNTVDRGSGDEHN